MAPRVTFVHVPHLLTCAPAHLLCCGFAALPGEDSNLDKQDQNLLCYHYTTG